MFSVSAAGLLKGKTIKHIKW